MVMLGKNSTHQTPSRSARLSPSISRTVATRRQRPTAKTPSPLVAHRPHLRRFSAPKFSLFIIIAVSCSCIVVALIANLTFDPVLDAANAMAELADDYYIEFLYPSTLDTHTGDPALVLSKFTESGLPSVRLSHLLLYDDASHASYASYFNNKFYQCDTSHSYLDFYPIAPYGPHDYIVEYSPSCEEISQE